MILIAFSAKDRAGTNIAKTVLEKYSFTKTTELFQDNPIFSTKIKGHPVKLVTLKDETVYAQNLPEHFSNLDLVIFLSRHSSISGKPTLSVHTPGNFNTAELGGLSQTLSVCPAQAMCIALKELSRLKTEMQLEYEVSYECTHHGPSLSVPTMFVELGSSPIQWNDLKAAEVVGRAAMEAVGNFEVPKGSAVIGIGGPHYNRRFTQMALEDKAIFGHIIPKYALHLVTPEILKQCMERTLEKTAQALLDWKGIRGIDKPRLLKSLAEVGLSYQRV